mmetsp:Transcript_147989/g.258621  ORF Transcript_147989/g.258621 Transcript_147989/m.258621 type:complete len:288 (-) Transcript_147989:204-1067(-)
MDPQKKIRELEKWAESFAKKPRGGGTALKVAGGVGVVAALYNSFFGVEGGHKAIVFNCFTGLGSKTYGPGINFKMPFIEWPIIYDCRTRPSEISSASGSKDLQMVDLTLRVLYKPGDDLPTLYRSLGTNYAQRLLPSVGNEVMKSVLAQYNVGELLTRRSDVSAEINHHLTSRCRQFNVNVEDVAIVHVGFGREYSLAVEGKQVAQQQAERAKFLVEQAMQEKLSKIVLAEGEAESARLIGEAVRKNPGFMHLRKIEAAREISSIMSQGKNRLMLDTNSLLLDVSPK